MIPKQRPSDVCKRCLRRNRPNLFIEDVKFCAGCGAKLKIEHPYAQRRSPKVGHTDLPNVQPGPSHRSMAEQPGPSHRFMEEQPGPSRQYNDQLQLQLMQTQLELMKQLCEAKAKPTETQAKPAEAQAKPAEAQAKPDEENEKENKE
ncbi:uncharacterized protein LOC129719709 [Wyeomyia smithii]|uniref:uncharacterized protein LOC129719709 n=1 Tax=Wyeomyia smithii TaxID=174621 RepID=UPI002467C0FA|nr:uncharacterized protein LOC129719709 [Wyeomyia smithii]